MFQLNLGAPFKPDFGLSGAVAPAPQHSDHDKTVAPTRLFENHEEAITSSRGTEKRQSPIARTGDKLRMVRAIGSMQSAGREQPMVSAASYPPLQKTQEPALSVVEGTGHPQLRNGKKRQV
jgi:hypothetical protein